jgi:hypothetical protein
MPRLDIPKKIFSKGLRPSDYNFINTNQDTPPDVLAIKLNQQKNEASFEKVNELDTNLITIDSSPAKEIINDTIENIKLVPKLEGCPNPQKTTQCNVKRSLYMHDFLIVFEELSKNKQKIINIIMKETLNGKEARVKIPRILFASRGVQMGSFLTDIEELKVAGFLDCKKLVINGRETNLYSLAFLLN